MTIQELLDECECTYDKKDFKKLIELCDDVLKKDSDNPTAIRYKSISYCFLNQPQKALEILKEASKLHSDNYYHNIASMAYYDLGEYEKSIKCCDEGMEINDSVWLYENKIKALLKLDRIDEAMDLYENEPVGIEIIDILIETGKFFQALKYCLVEDLEDYESIIDEIKEKDTAEAGDYYISWIYNIKSKSDIRFCSDCGGELVPIVWGLPSQGSLNKAERGEIFFGGCGIPPNPPNYHCRKCHGEFDLGVEGLHIECEDYNLYGYIEYKINELTFLLKGNTIVFVRSLDSLKKQLNGFDDKEFDAFINHLKDLDYLCEPREGYVKLMGWDDLKCHVE